MILLDPLWPRALLALGALVIVPLGLRASAASVPRALLPCGALLGAAQLLAPGALAAALTLPWCAALLWQLWRSRELTVAYALVGAGWALFDRAGFRPLGFDPVIVLLTAVHFHFAGFALPTATRLAARERPGPFARAAVVGTLLGPPLVATGITATRLGLTPTVEAICAALMAAPAALSGVLHLRVASHGPGPPVARALLAVAGLSLLPGAALALLYGLRFHVRVEWLDVPWMWAVHGSLNALGFGLAGLAGWLLCARSARRPSPPGR